MAGRRLGHPGILNGALRAVIDQGRARTSRVGRCGGGPARASALVLAMALLLVTVATPVADAQQPQQQPAPTTTTTTTTTTTAAGPAQAGRTPRRRP